METEAKAEWAEAAGWMAVKAETEVTWAEVGMAWAVVEDSDRAVVGHRCLVAKEMECSHKVHFQRDECIAYLSIRSMKLESSLEVQATSYNRNREQPDLSGC